MNKFRSLLLKEIKELLTPQMIVPFVAMVFVFMGIGNVLGGEAEKQNKEEIKIHVIDYDKSDASTYLIESLKSLGYTLVEKDNSSTVIIPENFSENLSQGKQTEIDVSSELGNLSIINNVKTQKTAQLGNIINEITSGYILVNELGAPDAQFSKSPILTNDIVKFGNKSANISLSELLAYIFPQITVIPIVLFLVITLAAQLVATAIASEKENKTLETLLSMPVSRKAVVTAKLMASAIVSFFISALYLYGMRSYMMGVSGQATQTLDSEKVQNAMTTLGINLGSQDIIFLGVSLFLGILVALSLAFILGTFVDDIKSIQGAITPLMVMLLIPYILTMVIDINSLALPLKIIVYAIPFTHTFTAMTNIMLGRMSELYAGMGYLLITFIVAIITASKLFTSEKIFTLRLNFLKKK